MSKVSDKKNYTDTERLNWLISTGSYGYIDSSGDQKEVRCKIDGAMEIDAPEQSAFWECSKCSKLVFRDRVRCSFCDATRTYTCPECQSEMPGHHANYCSLYKSQK